MLRSLLDSSPGHERRTWPGFKQWKRRVIKLGKPRQTVGLLRLHFLTGEINVRHARWTVAAFCITFCKCRGFFKNRFRLAQMHVSSRLHGSVQTGIILSWSVKFGGRQHSTRCGWNELWSRSWGRPRPSRPPLHRGNDSSGPHCLWRKKCNR